VRTYLEQAHSGQQGDEEVGQAKEMMHSMLSDSEYRLHRYTWQHKWKIDNTITSINVTQDEIRMLHYIFEWLNWGGIHRRFNEARGKPKTQSFQQKLTQKLKRKATSSASDSEHTSDSASPSSVEDSASSSGRCSCTCMKTLTGPCPQYEPEKRHHDKDSTKTPTSLDSLPASLFHISLHCH
jgi:hypothetical protein